MLGFCAAADTETSGGLKIFQSHFYPFHQDVFSDQKIA